MRVLVTGVAGFVGHAVASYLLRENHEVVGIDNLNDYYDVQLKEDRLAQIRDVRGFEFLKLDLADRMALEQVFKRQKIEYVIHLAAQAGVRYSLSNPQAYVDSNLIGFMNLLESVRANPVKHFVYASSSSVYGLNVKTPFSVNDPVDHPISLYAATKKSNELLAHSYSHLFNIPTSGLRFFTVYGPWGRPDMALFLFTKAIFEGRPIEVFNRGEMMRDFTYIDDIVEGVVKVMSRPPLRKDNWTPESGHRGESSAPYRVVNIGNGRPVALMDFISAIESEVGVVAKKDFRAMQPGDVVKTWADTKDLYNLTGYRPKVSVEDGVKRFVAWFRDYYGK